MFKDKFNRHTLAFLLLSLASAALYFAAQAGSAALLWSLLGLDTLAALIVLFTR
jgi:hypothetical protein